MKGRVARLYRRSRYTHAYTDGDVITLVYFPELTRGHKKRLDGRKLKGNFDQKIPGAYPWYLRTPAKGRQEGLIGKEQKVTNCMYMSSIRM